MSATGIDSIRLHASHAAPRLQSSNLDFADTLRQGASNGARALSHAAYVASPYVPGAAVVSAALNNSAQQLSMDAPGGAPLGSASTLPSDAGIATPSAPISDPGVSAGFANNVQGMDGMLKSMRTEGEQMLRYQQQTHDTSFRLASASAALKVSHEARTQIVRNIAQT